MVSELLDLLSRKPLHHLFGLFFCLFFIQTPCEIIFFTKLLVGVSLEKKRNPSEQVLAHGF